MGGRATDYLYIAATIIGTVYGQFMVKWRIGGFGPLPDEPLVKLRFLISLLFDPMIFSGFAAFWPLWPGWRR